MMTLSTRSANRFWTAMTTTQTDRRRTRMPGQTADGIYICSALNIDLELIRYPLPKPLLTAHMPWSAVSVEREEEKERCPLTGHCPRGIYVTCPMSRSGAATAYANELQPLRSPTRRLLQALQGWRPAATKTESTPEADRCCCICIRSSSMTRICPQSSDGLSLSVSVRAEL